MGDLLTELREHDLPPKWDGRVVVWLPWEYAPMTTYHLHAPGRQICAACGMPSYERGFPCWSSAWGLRADSSRLTREDFDREEAARALLPWRVRGKLARHWWRNLCAFRCHHCQHDAVWDVDTDEWWDLDHTDYGDEGSL